ncbi:MAG: DDE-type integrase/transposase/recombinase, partial [Planctomycetes bacterium]|nr:DDE-type integrase/transposase/recombinase [Planctomycetota bacterium]
PWLTTIEDARSRCIVGWHLGDAPHQDAILSAMRMAFREWAVPQRAYIDQGKDFTSELLTGVTKQQRTRYRKEFGPDWRNALRHQEEVFWFGVLGELGVEVNYAIPYHAWSKGIMERWYGTFEDHCAKTFITYCGNSTMTRPECLEQIKRGYTDAEKRTLQHKYGSEWKRHAVLKLIDQSEIPTLEEAAARVGEWIELYQRSAHRGEGMNGCTPLAVWATASSLRKAGDEQLLALMQARGVYRVGGNGVAFQLAGSRHSYGATSSALRRFVGRDVFITLDPAHCECCHAYTADPQSRVYIGRLEANQQLPANCSIDELRRASKEVNQRRKAFNRAAAEAPQRIRNAAHEVAAHRREQLAEARATGTDNFRATPNIVPVRTGFEGVSIPSRTPIEPVPDEYAHINLDDLDFWDPLPEADDDEESNDPYAGIDTNSLEFNDDES